MSNINDETNESYTGVSNGGTTSTLEINSSDNGDDVTVYVDDNSGSAPADFTLIVERYSSLEDRWMDHQHTSITGASNPQSLTVTAVPGKMRVSIQNDSGASADYRVNVVSY